VRILVSTFGPDDSGAVIQAMRLLSYDRLVLIGDEGIGELPELDKIRRLEEISGHALSVEELEDDGFIGLVNSISEVIERHARGGRDSVTLNISGGSKLMGDAAILAAFRHGVETYLCGPRLVRLPVLKGVTAKDRFTASQLQMIKVIGDGTVSLDELVSRMGPSSRQAVERTLRELKNQGLFSIAVSAAKVLISLSETGLEVLRAVRLSDH
jgi:biotin operon repressor